MKTIEILKDLIAIPSWVDDKNNEAEIGEFIYNYLKKNSQLVVTKQAVSGKRCNIIVQNGDIDTLVIGHMDTVQPSQNWTKDPTEAFIKEDRLYGLGSSDMKNGLAIMLSLATNTSLKPNTGFLFYVDEEYDFLGMRSFVDEYATKVKPKQIISLDGSDLCIGNGCRGLIEVTCTIKGQSGHAARPQSGINAITATYQVLDKMSDWLKRFTDADLGETSWNLAYINGGQFQGEADGTLILGKQGNIIPDICQFVLDIRPSSSSLSAQKIVDFIGDNTKDTGASLSNWTVRHDLGSWLTEKKDLPQKQLGFSVSQASRTGYIDLQMLWRVFGQVPCFTLGASEPDTPHKPDEYVRVSKVEKLEQILTGYLTLDS